MVRAQQVCRTQDQMSRSGCRAGEPGQVRTRLGTGTGDVRRCASSLLLLQNEADPLPSTAETHNRSSLQAPSHPKSISNQSTLRSVPPQLSLSAAELRFSCHIVSRRRIYLLALNIQKRLKTEPRDTKMRPRPEISESSLFREAHRALAIR